MKKLFGFLAAALLGVSAVAPAHAGLSVSSTIQRPYAVYDSTGVTSYDATTRVFSMSATILAVRFDGIDVLLPLGQGQISMSCRVANNGALIGGAYNQADFVMSGTIDVDNDGNPEYSGTLLTGEIYSFGFLEAGATDNFDAKFRVTGGSMAGLYGNKVGLLITAEHSSFNNSFCQSFTAGAKGTVGNLDGDNTCPRSPGYWKNRCNWPTNSLTIGGVCYNRWQLQNILCSRLPNGCWAANDAGVRLARFLIASKLSFLNGSDDPDHVVELMSLADAFLAAHAPGSTLSDDDADYANDLADQLSDFVSSRPTNCDCNSDWYSCDNDDRNDCNHHGRGSRCGGGAPRDCGSTWHGFGTWCRRR